MLKIHDHRIVALAQMETNSDVFLFSGSFDSTICVLSMKTLEVIERLQIHKKTVRGLLVTKDYFLYSVGDDMVVNKTKFVDSDEYIDKKKKGEEVRKAIASSSVSGEKSAEVKSIFEPTIEIVTTKFSEIGIKKASQIEISPNSDILWFAQSELLMAWDIKMKKSLLEIREIFSESKLQEIVVFPSGEGTHWLCTIESESVGFWLYGPVKEENGVKLELIKMGTFKHRDFIVKGVRVPLKLQIDSHALLICDLQGNIFILSFPEVPPEGSELEDHVQILLEFKLPDLISCAECLFRKDARSSVLLFGSPRCIMRYDLFQHELLSSFGASEQGKADCIVFDSFRGLLYSSSGKQVRVWLADDVMRISDGNGIEPKSFLAHSSRVQSLCLLSENNLLASGTIEGIIFFWDLHSMTCSAKVSLSNAPVTQLILSAQGRVWSCQNNIISTHHIKSDNRIIQDARSIEDEGFIRASKSKEVIDTFTWKQYRSSQNTHTDKVVDCNNRVSLIEFIKDDPLSGVDINLKSRTSTTLGPVPPKKPSGKITKQGLQKASAAAERRRGTIAASRGPKVLESDIGSHCVTFGPEKKDLAVEKKETREAAVKASENAEEERKEVEEIADGILSVGSLWRNQTLLLWLQS